MYNNFLTLFQTGGIISADISCCLLYMKGQLRIAVLYRN